MTTGVAVQFKTGGEYVGRKYTYLTDRFSEVLKIGDLIVVKARGRYVTARVCEVGVPADNPNINYRQAERLYVEPT